VITSVYISVNSPLLKIPEIQRINLGEDDVVRFRDCGLGCQLTKTVYHNVPVINQQQRFHK